jgi:predicted HTH transcriptional regulator
MYSTTVNLRYEVAFLNQELIKLLKNFKDHFIERKLDSAATREFRKTIVAFANCIPEGRTAVLFIGVHDDSKVQGVSNPDKTQKKDY